MFRAVLCILVLSSVLSCCFTKLNVDSLRLTDGKEDSCLMKNTKKESLECMLELLEMVLGDHSEFIPLKCENYPKTLVMNECKGCPWRRVNETALKIANETGSITKKEVMDELLEVSGYECSIHNLVTENFMKYEPKFSFFMLTMGVLIFAVITAFAVPYEKSGWEPQTINERQLPEWLYLALLWLSYYVGRGFIQVYINFAHLCASVIDAFAEELILLTTYLGITLYSYARCLNLPPLDEHESSQKTWVEFSRRSRSCVSFVLVYVARIGLVIIIVLEFLHVIGVPGNAFRHMECNNFGKDRHMGLLLYLLGIFKILIISVYATRHSFKRRHFWVRYTSAIVIACASIAVMLAFRERFDEAPYTMLIPRVRDDLLISGVATFTHTMIIWFLTLLEPIRLGWPPRDSRNGKTQPHTA